MPSSVELIGDGAFSDCRSLKDVDIPASVGTVGSMAFSRCDCLTGLNLKEGLKEIGHGAFVSCVSLQNISIPSSVQVIGRNSFQGCISLMKLDLKEGLKEIHQEAFSHCNSIKVLNAPSSVEIIESSSFKKCFSLEKVSLKEGLRRVGYSAFEDCTALHGIEIPSTVVAIGHCCFRKCKSLSDVKLSPRLLTLEDSVFKSCMRLRAISLPQSIETIGYATFWGCSGLVSVEFPYQRAMSISLDSFGNCRSLANISIPSQSTDGSFFGCDRLEEQRGAAEIGHLTTLRWQEHPVHRKCLYASVTTVEELREEAEYSKVEDTSQQHGYSNLVDSFGMTPLHVLLSSATPRLDLLKVLLDAYPSAVIGMKDSRGKRALDYLVSSCTTQSKNLMKVTIEAWTLNRSFVRANEVARNDMTSRIAALFSEWSGEEKLERLRSLCTAQEGYENAEKISLLEMWLWKMAMLSFANTYGEGPVVRSACRFGCGALFSIPAIIEFCGRDIKDSYSSNSDNSDTNSSSSYYRGLDEDYRYDASDY
ncbi:unnamed protein product [Cylindrotheca closterium]|uniref:Uncharacterized protein n=1 Tax=Cylindrotheca closterium TaxID=2856 RepID=A0AAD2FCK2_9STRA|nr:unnamed protein product [Cylindrotheca closterium]